MIRFFFLFAACFVLTSVDAAEYPAPVQGDFVVQNFRFASGEKLPELRLHYRTLGTPQRDAQGIVRNAVLILRTIVLISATLATIWPSPGARRGVGGGGNWLALTGVRARRSNVLCGSLI